MGNGRKGEEVDCEPDSVYVLFNVWSSVKVTVEVFRPGMRTLKQQ